MQSFMRWFGAFSYTSITCMTLMGWATWCRLSNAKYTSDRAFMTVFQDRESARFGSGVYLAILSTILAFTQTLVFVYGPDLVIVPSAQDEPEDIETEDEEPSTQSEYEVL